MTSLTSCLSTPSAADTQWAEHVSVESMHHLRYERTDEPADSVATVATSGASSSLKRYSLTLTPLPRKKERHRNPAGGGTTEKVKLLHIVVQ